MTNREAQLIFLMETAVKAAPFGDSQQAVKNIIKALENRWKTSVESIDEIFVPTKVTEIKKDGRIGEPERRVENERTKLR